MMRLRMFLVFFICSSNKCLVYLKKSYLADKKRDSRLNVNSQTFKTKNGGKSHDKLVIFDTNKESYFWSVIRSSFRCECDKTVSQRSYKAQVGKLSGQQKL